MSPQGVVCVNRGNTEHGPYAVSIDHGKRAEGKGLRAGKG